MTTALVFIALVLLGVSAGALLAEATLLVPFWRALAPRDFLSWYQDHGSLLVRFFGPLEIATAVFAIAAAGVCSTEAGSLSPWLATAAGTSIAVLLAFPVYFKRANASFADGSIAPERVAGELAVWARWHSARVALSVLGFGAGLGFALFGAQGS